MAQPNPIVPATKDRDPVVSWPGKNEETFHVQEHGSNSTVRQAEEVLTSGVSAANDALEAAKEKFIDAKKDLTAKLRKMADERPLYFVAVVAGLAFATGVILRVWRSRQYE